jgi:hypothetical protein
MMAFDPSEERAGVVQAETNLGMLLKHVEEGAIAAFVGKFENMVKVADRLVGMDHQCEMQLLGHGD